jgi:hypothetical protein
MSIRAICSTDYDTRFCLSMTVLECNRRQLVWWDFELAWWPSGGVINWLSAWLAKNLDFKSRLLVTVPLCCVTVSSGVCKGSFFYSFQENVLQFKEVVNVGKSKATSCVPATGVHALFPPTHLSGQTRVSKWGCPASKCVASERAKRTLWLEAGTKLVCPLLAGRSCGRQR